MLHDSPRIRRSIHTRLLQILLKNTQLKGWFMENFENLLGIFLLNKFYFFSDFNSNSKYFIEAKLTLTKLIILNNEKSLIWSDFLTHKTLLIALLSPKEEVKF